MQGKLGAFLAYLMGLAKKGEAADEQSVEDATALLKLRTLLAARSDPDGALEPDDAHPGYLTREVEGSAIFVPFNLVSVAPRANILAEVVSIARSIALHADDPICISGSTTFLGALAVVADLDFCEYYLGAPAGMGEGISRLASLEDIPLIWTKLGGENLAAPLDLTRVAAMLAMAPDRMKMDFMSHGALGILPVSNVILATRDGEDGAAHRSHAYQEAVIAGGSPVRNLVRPDRLGTYLEFLRTQVEELVQDEEPKSSVKALKRVLSLMLFLGYDDSDRVIALLEREEISSVVNTSRLKELRDMEAHLPPALSERFSAAICDLEAACADIDPEDVKTAVDAARDYARDTVARIEQDLAEYA